MNIAPNGWLDVARHRPSPHHNDRPDPDDISLLVIHNISLPPGVHGDRYINALFAGTLPALRHEHPYLDAIAGLRVAAHFLILRDGSITQYVPTVARAWHAGVSRYQGRENCNDFSIGIELNGSDHAPYTLRQYQALAALSRAIIARHPRITPARITGHSDIAPDRKTDPGPAFNWHYYRTLLAQTGGCPSENHARV
ncbi:MAG: 1,6-anhydro-N-acetylmuramyl-L-alanine amidase AmpD [Cardiobacterium sp.]